MEKKFENPSFLIILASIALTPVLILVISVLALKRRIKKAKMNRWYKKTMGRKMNTIEEMMFDMDNPLKFP